MYRIDYPVLDALGKLVNTLGNEVSVHKLTPQSELRPPTPAEAKWIEEVLKRLIRSEKISRLQVFLERARQDSNLRPSDS